MGQRTRMGKAKTGGRPISRDEYAVRASDRQSWSVRAAMLDLPPDALHPGYLDNAAGRARHAAKHAAEPRVKYERTGQGSGFAGPKTAKPRPPVRIDRCIPMRKIDGVWIAIAA